VCVCVCVCVFVCVCVCVCGKYNRPLTLVSKVLSTVTIYIRIAKKDSICICLEHIMCC
jgi:hypothetical protein